MSVPDNLTKLVRAASTHQGSWENVQLVQEIKMTLWSVYDPRDDLIYPTISHWDDLLAETIETDGYDTLTQDEVLSILFGLIHRNRIVEGLWWAMFERGATQKLLGQLLALDTD